MIDRLNDPTEASIIHGQLQSWIQAYYEKKGLSEGELSVLYRSYGNLFIVTLITLTSTNPFFYIYHLQGWPIKRQIATGLPTYSAQ